ncbi:multidrug efflux RND transporter permease subunit [Oxalobacter paraformigenes]|uniref:Hydrophobe/amphiphile efflux-1 (HAE1) family RND transporter n=1 Tax=Oxalobacter paraformigenes TaxID=556268 RepID=C3X438_9BURK|nr:multidrug efflux RND transporter permease subunit [Oxalobacter paraformigenes]EEO27974.1 hydrophobe/amphiphile efflux-1 (HAE1) family RND transporter [Oxalobacter paraformigenes]
MTFSELFIRRPVATVLVTVAILLAGIVAFNFLPVSPLPQVDFPTIRVRAKLPGASPETMAATVATPLERSLGRIAGITEITSTSTLGTTDITLQFDLSRNIDGAARDVQSAINAARALLPTGMPSNPTYRKINPADAPIMILSMTSGSLTRGQMYDAADTIVAQKLMQTEGIGDVFVGGGSQPAVRIDLHPQQLSRYGISLEQVRNVITDTNVNRPKGFVGNDSRQWKIEANDQAKTAKDYLPLIVHHASGATLRLADVADVTDSVQDVRNIGMVNGEPCVMLIIFREPGANIIETVERVYELMPALAASIPESIDLNVVMDRTPTIRSSLADVEFTLLISVGLVILVVFLFLRNVRATAISAISVPVSLVGTFTVMYLAGFSLNNLSLMALTIATGFVVDDTIVVLENIMRHIEGGMKPFDAALKGAREVGFTVLSISISLIAVFIPILLMGGIIGRLFREFAVTLSVTILVSLFISLTTTPMLCALWLKRRDKTPGPGRPNRFNRLFNASEHLFASLQLAYARTLKRAIDHRRITLLILMATIAFNVFLYIVVPKGFFPQQDTGRMFGVIRADQSISFQAMQRKMEHFIDKIREDPAIDQVSAYTGSSQSNTARMFISLKPLSERDASADEVIARLRKRLVTEPGATLFLQSVQDIRMGGRPANAQYQYTLQGDDLNELREWTPKAFNALSKLPMLADLNTDQELKGLQTLLAFDRDAMARLGLTQKQVDDVLYDAFGQRQVSTIYNELNQYKVVMEVAPQYWQNPEALNHIYLQTPKAGPTPLSAIARWEPVNTSLSVNHQGQFAASTLSFNLPPGQSLSEATVAIEQTLSDIGLPSSIVGSFQGTAKTFRESLSSQPMLIALALVAVYIVLGMLYESFIHPVTILSTLPSAGVGALLALILAGSEFSVIALIGVLLLIGIVKKNAIMMIDFALVAEREEGLSPENAIYQACLLRFRPIMMTTTAALFGALPLALGHGDGAEMRIPLGISIVGGLMLSQLLTLYTTPVVYLYLDRFQKRAAAKKAARAAKETA